MWTIIRTLKIHFQPALQFNSTHTHSFNYGITRNEILTQPGLKSMTKALSEGQIN